METPPARERVVFDEARYYAQMRTARIGLGLGGGGVVSMVAGGTLILGARDDAAVVAGLVLVGGGALGYLAGAPVMNAGAMGAGKTL